MNEVSLISGWVPIRASAKPAFFEPSGWRWDPSAENREAIFLKKEAWFKKCLASAHLCGI